MAYPLFTWGKQEINKPLIARIAINMLAAFQEVH